MNDPIADMLTRIRNGIAARKSSVSVPHSKIKIAIAEILKTNGFITDYRVEDEKSSFSRIVIELAEDGEMPSITELTRISKPGRRIFSPSKRIPTVLAGRGIVIVSTPSGLMTGREAKRLGLGGELICKVW